MANERKLDEIIKKMKELEHSDDTEMAHVYADDLLAEAIKALSMDNVEEKADVLLEAYDNVPKWYA